MLSELLLTEMARLSADKNLPLHRQLYEALRRAILDGKLGASDRLPSSREITHDLGLSRNTVVAAINQLSVEGYLVSRVGSGTYLNDTVPKAARHRPVARIRQNAGLSRRGQALSTAYCSTQLEVQPFTSGIADFSAFPVTLWQRLQNTHWRMTVSRKCSITAIQVAMRPCAALLRTICGFPQRAGRRRSGHHHQWHSSRWSSAPSCWRTTGTPCGWKTRRIGEP